MAKETDGLSEAMRREKDARVYKKIMALVFVPEDDIGVPEATKIRCSENSVRNRLARFSEDGIDGLRDLPCSGCRPEADRKRTAATTDLSIERNSTDVTTVRDDTRDATWIEYDTGHVRRLVRRHGLSRRRVQNVHASHAAPSPACSWQRYLEDVRAPCLKSGGLALVSSDEAFFVQGSYDRCVWGPTGTRGAASYSGNHAKVAVFGSIAEDGEKPFGTFTGSLAPMRFMECLGRCAKSDRAAVFCGRRSAHRDASVAECPAAVPTSGRQ